MSVCVLDADVVIAALDSADANHSRAAKALEQMARARTTKLLSTINYAEALVWPAQDDSTLRTAVRALHDIGLDVIAPTPAVARDAARLSLGVGLPDGFALATARAHGASLATFDRRVRAAARRAGLELA